MPYNPWTKRPSPLPERTREFTLRSGEKLMLTLRKLGTVAQTEVFQLSERLIERYVTGDAEYVESKGKSGEGPFPFPPMGGVSIAPNEMMIRAAAFLYVMQEGPAEDIIPVDAWIAFQAVEDPADWKAIQSFASEVNRLDKPTEAEEADVPKPSAGGTRGSYAPGSAGIVSTPNSLLERMPYSGASTSGSEAEKA